MIYYLFSISRGYDEKSEIKIKYINNATTSDSGAVALSSYGISTSQNVINALCNTGDYNYCKIILTSTTYWAMCYKWPNKTSINNTTVSLKVYYM